MEIWTQALSPPEPALYPLAVFPPQLIAIFWVTMYLTQLWDQNWQFGRVYQGIFNVDILNFNISVEELQIHLHITYVKLFSLVECWGGTRALHVVSEWLSTEPHPCLPHCYLQSDFYTIFAEWACCLTAVMSKNGDEIIFILLGHSSRSSSLTVLVLEARVLGNRVHRETIHVHNSYNSDYCILG